MARPIEPTPTLKGTNAKTLAQDIERIRLSSSKREELQKCVDLYHKFYRRLSESDER
jgi:hypothetical protein